MASHSLTNYLTSSAVVGGKNMIYPFPIHHGLVHRDLFSPVFWYSCGAIDFSIVPFIQFDAQKRAFFPLPIDTVVDALKRISLISNVRIPYN